MLDECIRVSKKYIILSLPNAWCVIKGLIIFGRGKCKFYGLPINKPKDRHKWFFNYNQAREFVFERAKINNCEVISYEPYCFPAKGFFKKIIRFLLKIIVAEERYSNWFYGAIWFIIRKRD